ncbi:hypothetical protein EGW08_015506, partial [Elysia chlorotica]
MAKGYVRAWAEQINQHGPPSGGNSSQEPEEDGTVGVQALVKKLSQSSNKTDWQTVDLNGKEFSSSAAQESGAFTGERNSPQSASEAKNTIRNDVFQSIIKAADKKKKSTLDVKHTDETAKGVCSPLHSQENGQKKLSPASAKKNLQPVISKTLERLNIDCAPGSNLNPGNEAKCSPTSPQRKTSASWSSSVESPHHRSYRHISPPLEKPKLSPKPKPPVDYSRKPSLDLTKKNIKRPSLPSQALISTTAQSELQQHLSVFKCSASNASSQSSSPSSPSSYLPQESSQDLVYQNLENVSESGSKSEKTDAIDNDVFLPQSQSDVSSVPQISVTVTQESSNPNTEPCLRLRSSAGRTSAASQYRESVLKTIYDNSPPLDVAELFDSSWSDSD